MLVIPDANASPGEREQDRGPSARRVRAAIDSMSKWRKFVQRADARCTGSSITLALAVEDDKLKFATTSVPYL